MSSFKMSNELAYFYIHVVFEWGHLCIVDKSISSLSKPSNYETYPTIFSLQNNSSCIYYDDLSIRLCLR